MISILVAENFFERIKRLNEKRKIRKWQYFCKFNFSSSLLSLKDFLEIRKRDVFELLSFITKSRFSILFNN